MTKSKASPPPEPYDSVVEAYRLRDESGRPLLIHVFGWWEQYPELPRARTLKAAHEKLVKLGSDPGFVTKALTVLTEAPRLRFLQAMSMASIPIPLL